LGELGLVTRGRAGYNKTLEQLPVPEGAVRELGRDFLEAPGVIEQEVMASSWKRLDLDKI